MIRNTTNTVLAWSNAEPDEVTRRFHNMLIHEYAWAPRFRALLDLFADWPPPSYGRYLHHDGWRKWARR